MITVSMYAAVLGLLYFYLSIRVIRLRRKLQVVLGDAGNKNLIRAISVHSNFAEYVPICLLLLYFVETQTSNLWMIHILGISLVVGRLSHAYGVSQKVENLKFRVFGMVMTFSVITLCSIILLFQYAV